MPRHAHNLQVALARTSITQQNAMTSSSQCCRSKNQCYLKSLTINQSLARYPWKSNRPYKTRIHLGISLKLGVFTWLFFFLFKYGVPVRSGLHVSPAAGSGALLLAGCPHWNYQCKRSFIRQCHPTLPWRHRPSPTETICCFSPK